MQLGKIHVSQMSDEFRGDLDDKLLDLKTLSISNHTIDRLNLKNIRIENIVEEVLDNIDDMSYSPIEYKILEDDERVVIRFSRGRNIDLCVVISLKNKSIITVWENLASDKHSTLDLSVYNPNLKLKWH